MTKFTKIVATLGPSSDSVEKIKRLHNAGMSVARLNFSHGTHEYFSSLIEKIRSVSNEIAIMLDTKGPELRTGEVENNSISLEDGDEIIFTSKNIMGTPQKITILYDSLCNLIPGNIIMIDDGLIEAQVIEKKGNEIIAKILNGGILSSRKTVSIKGHSIDLPFLSSKDKKDIDFAVKNNVDFIAASFIRRASEVRELKAILESKKSPIRVISKIEHGEAVKNIDEIISESDGIMVARGDLGVEIELEKVPSIQSDIIKKCNFLGKPVIVATQMLESMRINPRPTRAEVSDVAVAILQGADAIMLSGETASGKYPLKSVQMMSKIAGVYDMRVLNKIYEDLGASVYNGNNSVSVFVTRSAYDASRFLNTAAILSPTESGFTPRNVSRFKPKCPIYAITPSMTVLRQLQISWGVFPVFDERKNTHKDHDCMVNFLVKKIHEKGFVSDEDLLLVTSGHLIGESGHTNMIEIYKVNQVIERTVDKK